MRRRLPLILAALLLAGCLAPGGDAGTRSARVGNASDVGCARAVQLVWDDPAVFEGLWNAADGVRVERSSPRPMFPFDAPEIPDAWRSATLGAVWWRPDAREFVALDWHDAREATVSLPLHLDAERNVALVEEFLDALGLGDHPDHAAWMRELRERDPARSPSAPHLRLVDAPPDLDALRARLAREGPPTLETPGGGAILRWGEWDFRFAFAHVVAQSPDVQIVAEASGRVHATATLQPYVPEGQTLRARVDGLLAELGLPPASYEGAEGGGGPPRAC